MFARYTVSSGIVVVLLAVLAGASPASEVQFPTFSYEGAELERVREWEKKWAGTRITRENIDQVKEYVHEGVYKAMTEPELLNTPTVWFDIVPYRPYTPSPGMIEATRKYGPDRRLDAHDNMVGFGDVAGIPFTQPETGVQMAWNFDSNTKGDSHHLFHEGTVVDCRTRFERTAGHLRWEMRWMGRYDVPPLPKIPDSDNPRGIYLSFFQRHTAPVDFVDTTMLELRYQDQNRATDLWVYTAMFRRVRRYSTNQRTDTIDGTDMIYDDQDGWYTHPGHNTYRFLGRQDLLFPRHQDSKVLERERGQGFWSGAQRERVNVWVVEAINKDSNYIYSKQIWYLDPESWTMLFKVMYNRQGELWKMYEMFHNEYPSEGGHVTALFNGEHVVDFIRRHGSPGNRENRGIGIDIPRTMFQVSSLSQRSY